MNRKIKVIVLLICSFLLLSGFTPAERAATFSSANTTETSKFLSLQNNISNHLTVHNGKYEYDAFEIRDLIYHSNVNFELLSKELGYEITPESFFQSAIERISSTKKPIPIQLRLVYSSTCNVNRTTSDWNYDRVYRDKNKSSQFATSMSQVAVNIAGGTAVVDLLASFVPDVTLRAILVKIVTAVGGAGAWYFSSLSNAVSYKNSDGDCGTVTDLNQFILTFTVWSQREWYR